MIRKKIIFENEYLSIRKKPLNLEEGDQYLFVKINRLVSCFTPEETPALIMQLALRQNNCYYWQL